MIQAHDICLSFIDQPIFNHISFIINDGQKIGLVGRNGSGKSTLLKAINNPSILDAGTISIMRGKKIAYMPQEVILNSPLSIIDETCTAFKELRALQEQAKQIEAQLNQEHAASLFDTYTQIQEQIAQFNPDALRAQAKKMLMGLGFKAEQLESPVTSLSVGWKMRIVLAQLLLQDADFYLFDEPTNHLDLIAKEWFLHFLQQSEAGFLLVCHEKYFLDTLCTDILELEFGNGTWYTGNYSKYLTQKEHNKQLREAAYEQQQKEIKRKEETINRFRSKASKAKQMQSMMKALDKIERITLPPEQKSVSFSFPPVQQSGKTVLTVKNVAQTFGNKTIFEHVSFEIERNQKVALIAPNGVGKTTLFNIITGQLPLQQGTITLGYNVQSAIFAQDQTKVLDGKRTVLENLSRLCPTISEQTLRTFLGAFLFSNDDVHKKVQVLSGGEKNRVGMVSVLLQKANFLLLDEPTNHLDIPSKEVLLAALQYYSGTMLFVSHDKDFINALATHVIELTPDGAYLYHGNYDSYLQYTQKTSTPDQKKTVQQSPKIVTPFSDREQEKKLKKLESVIAALEREKQKVQESFADLQYGTAAFDAAQVKLHDINQKIGEAEINWEQLYKEPK